MKTHEITLKDSELFDVSKYSEYGFYLVECSYDYKPVMFYNSITIYQLTFTELETAHFLNFIKDSDKPAETTHVSNIGTDMSDKVYTLELIDKLSKMIK